MANWKGHIAVGVGAGVTVVLAADALPLTALASATHLLSDVQALTGLIVVAILFVLFPDVDTNSKAQDIFFGLAFICDVLLLLSGELQAAAYLGLIAMLPILGHHRGWTHSKWAMVVVPLPILALPIMYSQANTGIALLFYSAAVAGYFSHLLLDGQIIKTFRIKN